MDNPASLHEGHRQRLRRRYCEEGLDGFQDHEVIELLLFYCVPKRDTNAIAHRILKEFGTLAALLESRPEDIARRLGLSESTAVLLSMAAPLSRRYLSCKWGERPLINSSAKAGEYALTLFAGRVYEVFYVICLDAQNRVNHAAMVHEGTINEAPVYPRIIVETALRHKAATVILAHNHPGGSLKPSLADKEVTGRISQVLRLIGIPVVDHIIAAGSRYFSFAEENLLD